MPSRMQSWQTSEPAGSISAGAASRWSHAPVGSAGVGTGCSAVSRSARSVAIVSIDSSMSKEPSTCSITSWSTVPVLRIRSTSSRSTPSVVSRSRRYCSAGVSSLPLPSFSHKASGRAAIRWRTTSTVSGRVVGGHDLVQCGERGVARGLQHGGRLQRVRPRIGSAELEPTHQERQGQPLEQQRSGGHHHRGEHQQLLLRYLGRDDQRGGEGDHSAHPGPADDQGVRPRRRFVRRDRGRDGRGRPGTQSPRAAG